MVIFHPHDVYPLEKKIATLSYHSRGERSEQKKKCHKKKNYPGIFLVYDTRMNISHKYEGKNFIRLALSLRVQYISTVFLFYSFRPEEKMKDFDTMICRVCASLSYASQTETRAQLPVGSLPPVECFLALYFVNVFFL